MPCYWVLDRVKGSLKVIETHVHEIIFLQYLDTISRVDKMASAEDMFFCTLSDLYAVTHSQPQHHSAIHGSETPTLWLGLVIT